MKSEFMEKQVVSKQRVADHGEVLTGKREVNAMLDLVKQETERIDSRFLEPACGTGNFMTEILKRKLRIVESRYKKSQLEYERYAVLSVSSIYGIDILKDNIVECRKQLFQIFDKKYTNLFKNKAQEDCRNAVKYILEKNIICGDALLLMTVGDNPREIVFSEWSSVNGSMLKRRDFTFHELLPNRKKRQQSLFSKPEQLSLFSKPEQLLFSDLGEEAFIPSPVKEYPLIHFLRVANVEQ
jgi:hypothetical protein